jgi:hypothetical protein
MNYHHTGTYPLIGQVAVALADLAQQLVVEAHHRHLRATRPCRGGTLRPGANTPLWQALAQTVRPHLRRYGAKSNLARMLGVTPQRVHLCFKANSAMPDAERVLQLVVWLSRGAPPLVGPVGRQPWRKRPACPVSRGPSRLAKAPA